ncbi:hypothetical protein BGW42_008678 [Actinomortierella wolfii]|nr:hypothetical protein BGW42_008678 [Actinomortierella wolfii]
MHTVPPQEIAAFLGNHLDQVLQRTHANFLNTVAADREFKAACALMDVLNAAEAAQQCLRQLLLEKNAAAAAAAAAAGNQGAGHHSNVQNPFLCFFVDIYKVALKDERRRWDRFVTSIILSGDGEELAPSTPSELIALAQEAEPKTVDLGELDEILPEVPIEDQIGLGQGWDSAPRILGRGNKRIGWDVILATGDGHNGGTSDSFSSSTPGASLSAKEAEASTKEPAKKDRQEEQEEELEEWEIEAERRFQDSDQEDLAAPSLPVKKKADKLKKAAEPSVTRQQLNAIMEQAAVQPLTFEEEQLMLLQFSSTTSNAHVPLPPHQAIAGIVNNNPTIAFNLLLHLIQLAEEGGMEDTGALATNGNVSKGTNKINGHNTKASTSSASFYGPGLVDGYLEVMTRAKRLTLHSLEVVNRLSAATTLSPQFMHAYIENAIRCCENVEDKMGQARVVRMLCVFLQSLLRNGAITIPAYFHALQSFCVQFSRVKEVAVLFQSLVEYQRKMDSDSPLDQTTGSSSSSSSTPGPSTTAQHHLQQQQQQHQSQAQFSHQQQQQQQQQQQPRLSWLANTGSITNVKSTVSMSNKQTASGFSTPGALSQFIHPGPANGVNSSNSSHSGGPGHAGGSHSHSHSVSISSGGGVGGAGGSSGAGFKGHSKSHSSTPGSMFSSPTFATMSASVNAFNSGLGNSALNGSTGGVFGGVRLSSAQGGTSGSMNNINNSNGNSQTNPGHVATNSGNSLSGAATAAQSDYDLEAALRASIKDMDCIEGSSSSPQVGSGGGATGGAATGSRSGSGSNTANKGAQSRTPNNGLYQGRSGGGSGTASYSSHLIQAAQGPMGSFGIGGPAPHSRGRGGRRGG